MKSVPITTHLLTTLTNRMQQKLRINGEAVAASQEGTLAIELFLNENYRFRRNVLSGKVEFLTLPDGEDAFWRPLTQEALNSMASWLSGFVRWWPIGCRWIRFMVMNACQH